jgi:hypothetical protein
LNPEFWFVGAGSGTILLGEAELDVQPRRHHLHPEKTATMISAALETTPALEAVPSMTASHGAAP